MNRLLQFISRLRKPEPTIKREVTLGGVVRPPDGILTWRDEEGQAWCRFPGEEPEMLISRYKTSGQAERLIAMGKRLEALRRRQIDSYR